MQTIADPATLANLWARARAMFARVIAAAGAPAAIAALCVLARMQRRAIGAWLTRLETIVRKLLFAEAGHLPLEPHPPRRTPQPSTKNRASATPEFDASRPETWRARFAFAPPRDPRAVPEARAPRIRALWDDTRPYVPTAQPAQTAVARRATERASAKHLALRFEAIRRVLADPAPYVRRLARLFHRLRRRFPEAPRRFAIKPARSFVLDEHDPRLLIEAIAAAMGAIGAFDSS